MIILLQQSRNREPPGGGASAAGVNGEGGLNVGRTINVGGGGRGRCCRSSS